MVLFFVCGYVYMQTSPLTHLPFVTFDIHIASFGLLCFIVHMSLFVCMYVHIFIDSYVLTHM